MLSQLERLVDALGAQMQGDRFQTLVHEVVVEMTSGYIEKFTAPDLTLLTEMRSKCIDTADAWRRSHGDVESVRMHADYDPVVDGEGGGRWKQRVFDAIAECTSWPSALARLQNGDDFTNFVVIGERDGEARFVLMEKRSVRDRTGDPMDTKPQKYSVQLHVFYTPSRLIWKLITAHNGDNGSPVLLWKTCTQLQQMMSNQSQTPGVSYEEVAFTGGDTVTYDQRVWESFVKSVVPEAVRRDGVDAGWFGTIPVRSTDEWAVSTFTWCVGLVDGVRLLFAQTWKHKKEPITKYFIGRIQRLPAQDDLQWGAPPRA